jgi:hypothetical protein
LVPADNYYLAAEADRVAAGVHGINQVNDRLRVARAGVGYAHRRSIGPFGSHLETRFKWSRRGAHPAGPALSLRYAPTGVISTRELVAP